MTDYQKIRAAIEAPILTAFNSQVPSIPVYFDNVNAVPPDPPKEYIRVNITFGIMQEAAISGNLERPRGALVVRCFAAKGGGPARCQELVQIAVNTLKQVANTQRTDSGVFVRVGAITGPAFYGEPIDSVEPSLANQLPHFMGKISTGWQAILSCSE